MKNLITRIFIEQAFKVSDREGELLFFERSTPFSEYYLVDFVDESDWQAFGGKIDQSIVPFFTRMAEKAPDIYKNTSLIICVSLNSLENAGGFNFRRLSMAIEESPSYFRRYVIPYLESACSGFFAQEILLYISRKINDSGKFDAFSNNGFSDPEYHLAMQLATKLPFLSIRWDENGGEFKGTGISKKDIELLMPTPSLKAYVDPSTGQINNLEQLKKLVLDENQNDFFEALKQYANELDQ